MASSISAKEIRLTAAALHEACQTLLTGIEAIDPVTAALVEGLRLEVDKRLKDGRFR